MIVLFQFLFLLAGFVVLIMLAAFLGILALRACGVITGKPYVSKKSKEDAEAKEKFEQREKEKLSSVGKIVR